ncbi:MAG: 4Fe-4S binding protein [Clostridia bacterium]|nr:4Fe-4S binding protein [Clostridia bacterium]
MSKFTDKIKSLKPTKRKLIQLYAALLFNANFKGFATGNIYQGNTKKVCMPGLNCYSCPGAVTACPLGSLQGSFSADRSTLFYVGGIILLYCFLFGRLICGWLCPFGLIQELLYKIKTPKLKKGPITRILSFIKYFVLIFFVIIVPIMYAFRDTPLPAFCKYICPAGTLEGGIGLLANKVNESYFSMLGPLFTWKFLVLVSIIVGSIFIFRMFCRFICPLGALYGLFNRISVFGVKVDNSKCTYCNRCISRCKMDIKHVGDAECISCGDCIDVCPTKAISWKCSKRSLPETVYGHTKTRLITRIISCVILVAVLAGAIFYYWNADSNNVQIPNGQEQLEQGNEVGDKCYGAELNIITSDDITTDTVNPASTEKITVINFWGTWCTPCVNELPYFDQIADNYADDVTVIAVHTNMVSDTAPEYIKNHYHESNIIFARDLDSEGYYSMLGGRGTYPYTVVLDSDGVIVKIFFEALEYEDLETVVEAQLNS